jgi:hypothetical protein
LRSGRSQEHLRSEISSIVDYTGQRRAILVYSYVRAGWRGIGNLIYRQSNR